jgi:branched-chain amino acid transport system substrate-binding protein
MSVGRSFSRIGLASFVLTVLAVLLATSLHAKAADQSGAPQGNVEVAVSVPLSGDEAPYGKDVLEGMELATDEANAIGEGPRLVLKAHDDKADPDTGRIIAGQMIASRRRPHARAGLQ